MFQKYLLLCACFRINGCIFIASGPRPLFFEFRSAQHRHFDFVLARPSLFVIVRARCTSVEAPGAVPRYRPQTLKAGVLLE